MNARSGITLIDALVVVAVFAIIVLGTSSLIVDGLRGIALAQQRTETNRLVLILSHLWQESLRESTPDTWAVDDKGFHAGPLRFSPEHKMLRVDTGRSAFRVSLPPGMTPSFRIEEPEGLAACAVMDVTWTTRYRARETTNHVRLVACGRGAPDA